MKKSNTRAEQEGKRRKCLREVRGRIFTWGWGGLECIARVVETDVIVTFKKRLLNRCIEMQGIEIMRPSNLELCTS